MVVVKGVGRHVGKGTRVEKWFLRGKHVLRQGKLV
jgi:hypothetical protein